MSKSLLAAPHSMCELRALLCKTLITIADIIFKPAPHIQVVMYCIACGLLFYYHARMVSSSMQLQRSNTPWMASGSNRIYAESQYIGTSMLQLYKG